MNRGFNSSTRTKVDVDKLQMIIDDKFNGIQSRFDASIGKSAGWINNYIRGAVEKMANSDIMLIEALHGVDITYAEPTPEEVIEEKKEEETPQKFKVTFDDDMKRELGEIIYEAVYKALNG